MTSHAAAMYTINSSLSIGAVSVGSYAISFFICLNVTSASAVHWKSLFFVHFFKVLKNDSDFSADLRRNLFRLANFPFSFPTSFRHFGDDAGKSLWRSLSRKAFWNSRISLGL
ncbi:hypothetical protein Tco_0726755 [Tanacetum coccineum]|uniref:Uncharacterized protein n=1 Tax=Tanacetum coccineum TaxID=301880 RepID=A0ABQ4YGG5_9ASTR